jgi:hypothetical protein
MRAAKASQGSPQIRVVYEAQLCQCQCALDHGYEPARQCVVEMKKNIASLQGEVPQFDFGEGGTHFGDQEPNTGGQPQADAPRQKFLTIPAK